MSAFGRKKGFGGGGGETLPISLNLTALMDILSNLLFFLLASYQTADVEVVAKAGVQLPASTSEVAAQKNVTITVTSDEILVADVPTARLVNGAVQRGDLVGERIRPLLERLENVNAARRSAGMEGAPGSDTVFVLADKRVDSEVVTLILRTAGQAGFVNARFGVISR